MTKKLTTEEFIEKARAVHGDLYDYSKVVYVKNCIKVTIIDPQFGEWEQTPHHHLQGNGNPERGILTRADKKRSSTEKFIERARQIHGTLYNYSKVVYNTTDTKITIIDPKFGEFEQTPAKHLRGQGHPTRGGRAKLTTETFIEKARRVHGNLYDYSKVVYVNAHTKTIIIDPEFGEFTQTPNAHLRGQGNPTRSGSEKLTKKSFINKARKVHGDLYDYSKVVYVDSRTKVTIIDPEFGDWEQTPGNHLFGRGCPKRSNNVHGSLLYVIEVEQGLEHFAKVGITTVSAEKRFPKLSGSITTHYLYDFEDHVREVENAVLGYVKGMDGLQPAACLEGNGSTECFKPGLIPEVLQFLETNY